MGFFRRNKIDINSISIPDFGWEVGESDTEIKRWLNPEQTILLSINFFKVEPNLPTIRNIDILRNHYRNELAAHDGGLIQVDLINLKGINAVKTIFKLPQQERGLIYLSSLTIPFKDYSYVVKIQAPEVGFMGIRSAVITDRIVNESNISTVEFDHTGLKCDPYDKGISGGNLMEKSEEEQYDNEFPEHPLSQSRLLLKSIESQIEFGQVFEKIARFKR